MSSGIKPSGASSSSSTSAAESAQVDTTSGKQSASDASAKPVDEQDSARTMESSKQHAFERASMTGLESMVRFQELNEGLDHPEFKDVFKSQFVHAQTASSATRIALPKYADALFNNVAKSTQYDPQLAPANDQAKKDLDSASAELKKSMQSAKLLMGQGKYEQARLHLETTMSKKFGTVDGEHALRSMKGMGEDAVNATKSMMNQLKFVDKMQKAGVNATFPPTEKELKTFFATFKNNPSTATTEAAKTAFREYAEGFHIHPAKSSGDAAADIKYSADKTKTDGVQFNTANSWKEVTKDRKINDNGVHAGKHDNDCEGYAYLSEQLLGAAGFQVKGYVTGQQADKNTHIMVLLQDPQGKPVVTSNEGLYDESNTRLDPGKATINLLDAGWSGAGATGSPDYYIGNTSAESQSHLMHKVKAHNVSN